MWRQRQAGGNVGKPSADIRYVIALYQLATSAVSIQGASQVADFLLQKENKHGGISNSNHLQRQG